jgi:COP9 signalosome complex subunit 3
LSPITTDDILRYHYLGGLALLALKRFNEAATYLELVVTVPVQQHPSAIQLEALKKLVMVDLIRHGAVSGFTSSLLFQCF